MTIFADKIQHELSCHHCHGTQGSIDRDCRRCFFNQTPALHDRFFNEAVKPYIWFAAVSLFLSYVIGLLFTLRTHAAVIWNTELDEKKIEKMEQAAIQVASHPESRHGNAPADPRSHMVRQATTGTINSAIGTLPRENIRESQLYKRILGQSLKQAGLSSTGYESPSADKGNSTGASPVTPHLVPPKVDDEDEDRYGQHSVRIRGLSKEDSTALVRQVAEMAATAATVAARDATRAPRKASQMATTSGSVRHHHKEPGTGSMNSSYDRSVAHQLVIPGGDHEHSHAAAAGAAGEAAGGATGGHDAPNWSRTKSAIILLTATVAYAMVAEILVDTVDSVLEHVDIDEKFLGITLFALVPNTTEFLNAISFAMNGNIALSMEIGSAYALQVMLLQVPALVLYSLIHSQSLDPSDLINHTFTLIFPQWDMVTVILGVFLMGWVVGEGKSNYFKGSILILAYLVIVLGFWFSGYGSTEVSLFFSFPFSSSPPVDLCLMYMTNTMQLMGVNRFDTLALGGQYESFKTIGRSRSGEAY